MKTLIFVFLIAVPWLWTNAQDIRMTAHGVFESGSKKPTGALAFSSDGMLVASDEKGKLVFWDVDSRKVVFQTSCEEDVFFLGFLAGDQRIVSVSQGGKISVINKLDGSSVAEFRTRSKPLYVALDAGRRYLAAALKDQRIQVYDLHALAPTGQMSYHGRMEKLLFIGFDRPGEELIAIGDRGKVIVWSTATQSVIREMSLGGQDLYGSKTVVLSAATNRASNIFAVGLQEVALAKGGKGLMRDNKIVAYDWQTGTELKRIKTTARVDQLALGPGNDHVAIHSADTRSITLVDLRKGELGSSVIAGEEPLPICISGDNVWMAAGSKNGTVTVWKMEFRETASLSSAKKPSLSGRIRTTSGEEPALSADRPVKIAILEFESQGIAQDLAGICLNSLSNSLSNIPYLTLIERSQIEKVIKEQDFSMTDLSEQAGARVGQLLSADFLLLGSIGRLGSVFVLNARILDVASGKVTQGREVICEECRDQDIYDAIRMLSATIAR